MARDELDEALTRLRRVVIGRVGSDEAWKAVEASGAGESSESYAVAREHLKKRSATASLSDNGPVESGHAAGVVSPDVAPSRNRFWTNTRYGALVLLLVVVIITLIMLL